MWMFGSRTTVKKVRNSLTWFSQSFALADICDVSVWCCIFCVSVLFGWVVGWLLLFWPGLACWPTHTDENYVSD